MDDEVVVVRIGFFVFGLFIGFIVTLREVV